MKKTDYDAGWAVSRSISLNAHVQEEHALVQFSEVFFGGGRPRRRLARLLVLLPRRLLALGGAVECALAPCARFRAEGVADVALASRFLQHVLHLVQLSLVVLHVLDEGASGVVGAKDLLVDVLFGEVLSEEGGEGGGGDVLGGEAEDVLHFLSSIISLSKIKESFALRPVIAGSLKGKWVPMDHSKSKKHEGLGVCLAIASNLIEKFRIVDFEHFTHQLVIALIEELVTVCVRS